MGKKVLIINIQNHNYAGGIETYTRNLIPILHDLNYEIYEYSTCENIQSKVCEPIPYVHQIEVKYKNLFQELNLKAFNNNVFKFLYSGFKELKTLKYQKKELQKLVKDFDLVISNQTVLSSLSEKDHPRIIWVQHFDFKFLNRIAIFGRWILKILFKLKLPYKEFNKQVLFSKYSKLLYQKIYPKLFHQKTFYTVLLSNPDNIFTYSKNIDMKSKLPIVFLGRIQDVKQKRTDLANRIAKYLNNDVYAYGKFDKWLQFKYRYLKFQGPYSSKTDLEKIYNNASLTLITSDYEGMPYIGVESIMHSTPIAIRFSFAEAENLVKYNNGILLNKKIYPKKIAKQINELLSDQERYNQMIHNTEKWKDELSYQNFVNNWKEIIQKVTSL